jgi:uncharacterized protein YchJ
LQAAEILTGLTRYDRLPVDVLQAASKDRDALIPALVEMIERVAGGEASDERDGLLVVFHLLGEWRVHQAYRPLIALLRRPPEEVDRFIGDAITMTSHRVIAAVFDGDPQPIFELILDPNADQYVRSRMCETLAMMAVRGGMPREKATRFLDDCQFRFEAMAETSYVWVGWLLAIAMLGLDRLAPRVRSIFERGRIEPMAMRYGDFRKKLDYALEHPDAPHRDWESRFSPFKDTVAELSTWHGFSEAYFEERRQKKLDRQRVDGFAKDERAREEASRERAKAWREQAKRALLSPASPIGNPMRGVGRNDPCPCGSGLKYKKCCLAKV